MIDKHITSFRKHYDLTTYDKIYCNWNTWIWKVCLSPGILSIEYPWWHVLADATYSASSQSDSRVSVSEQPIRGRYSLSLYSPIPHAKVKLYRTLLLNLQRDQKLKTEASFWKKNRRLRAERHILYTFFALKTSRDFMRNKIFFSSHITHEHRKNWITIYINEKFDLKIFDDWVFRIVVVWKKQFLKNGLVPIGTDVICWP